MGSKADVLLVVVTDVETRAVIDEFQPGYGAPTSVTIGNRAYLDLGEVNGSRVLLLLSEMGSGGVGGAQQSISDALAALQPTAVLMVGIAFGVDDQKQSIGDVLVSQQLSLYELQRKGRKVRLRGDRPHASPRLLNFCRNAAVVSGAALGLEVRVGLLLTGEKLIDDIRYRNQLLTLEPEAIGGEMEGAGLYVACHNAKTDWIVIKAICDWADGNKSNPDKAKNQALAAKNAATFALSVLRTASFVLAAPGPQQSSLTEPERMLLLRLYDFQGTCLIRKAKGEQESLWVPGDLMDMQWGASSEDDRLGWIQTVGTLRQRGLLAQTKVENEYELTALGENIAWKLSIARPRKVPGTSWT
jgi:nucleoside phosphorylase